MINRKTYSNSEFTLQSYMSTVPVFPFFWGRNFDLLILFQKTNRNFRRLGVGVQVWMIWLEWFIWISWWFFRMMNDKIKSSQIMMQLNLWHSCFEMPRKQLQFIIWVSAYNRFRSYSILETFISILCPFFRKVLYFEAILTHFKCPFFVDIFNTFQISVFLRFLHV